MVKERTPKTQFQTMDGRTFDTKDEAERHERVEVARRAHSEAEEALNRALAESYETADGHPFKLGTDYYVVSDHIYGADYYREFFYWRECRINLDDAEPEIVRSRGWGDKAQTVRFPLSSVYWQEMADEGFAGSHEQFERLCFQPGCKEEGVVEYRLKDEYLHPYGVKAERREWRQDVRRRFCERHAQRGDCGLEDADVNYVLISAPPGWKGNAELGAAEAESPSARVDVQIDSLEDLPKAVDAARRLREKGES